MGYIEEGAVKVVEIIGVSEKSWEDAVAKAVAKASETIKGITGVEVVAFTARVRVRSIECSSRSPVVDGAQLVLDHSVGSADAASPDHTGPRPVTAPPPAQTTARPPATASPTRADHTLLV